MDGAQQLLQPSAPAAQMMRYGRRASRRALPGTFAAASRCRRPCGKSMGERLWRQQARARIISVAFRTRAEPRRPR
ncbi:hypothetical protein MRX96_013017 [Rhipicephalus microplus]